MICHDSENRGEWHIDHVVPCCAFGITLEEQKILQIDNWWKDDNLHKSGKYKLEDKIVLIEPMYLEGKRALILV